MLGNGSGTDFQVSQCIPMEAATLASTLPLPLPLGVFIPLGLSFVNSVSITFTIVIWLSHINVSVVDGKNKQI